MGQIKAMPDMARIKPARATRHMLHADAHAKCPEGIIGPGVAPQLCEISNRDQSNHVSEVMMLSSHLPKAFQMLFQGRKQNHARDGRRE
ncbi:hypothetical protein [Paenirhodobacter ferrireducens]|uniref:hypothetical protein n=1 Tax=Paenirhodobacter ferrireducens TaxID=1215032 RepID=UPI0013E345DF|nr:hypothetical protein [Sinirhodobacter ferrireducens]